LINDGGDYWIIRRSLSSDGARLRADGG